MISPADAAAAIFSRAEKQFERDAEKMAGTRRGKNGGNTTRKKWRERDAAKMAGTRRE
jgi:hypothetical protein